MTRAALEQRLDELLAQRTRIASAARYDGELREDLEEIDTAINACKREIANYCSECGNRLLLVNGRDVCCSGPCVAYGEASV